MGGAVASACLGSVGLARVAWLVYGCWLSSASVLLSWLLEVPRSVQSDVETSTDDHLMLVPYYILLVELPVFISSSSHLILVSWNFE